LRERGGVILISCIGTEHCPRLLYGMVFVVGHNEKKRRRFTVAVIIYLYALDSFITRMERQFHIRVCKVTKSRNEIYTPFSFEKLLKVCGPK
jgi:hypothetical protein